MGATEIGKCVFLTGATGILGGWILRDALDKGHRVIALMRDDSPEAARQRLAHVIHLVHGHGNTGGIEIVHGDVSLPRLGLSEAAIADLRSRVDMVIHCAASVSFEPKEDDAIWQANVGGVAQMLDLVRGTDIPFYHVSTAYVCGDRTGVVMESDLDVGQGFKNTYERSKVESERMIQQAFAEGTAKGAVFRPSIIVGASCSGKIAQFLNFYGFLKVMDAARSGRLLKDGFLRVALRPNCTKNLVPVDWAAAALWHIIENDGPAGLVYHLTHPAPVLQQNLLEWANARLDGHDVRVKFVEEITDDHSTLERMAKLCLRHYEPYLTTEPFFDRTNTERALGGALPFPETDHRFFDRLYDYARENKWQSIFSGKPKEDDAAAMDTEVCARGA